MTGKRQIGHVRLLAEVPSTSIEYLIKNSQAVKKGAASKKARVKKM